MTASTQMNRFSAARFTKVLKRTIALQLDSWIKGFGVALGLLFIIWFVPFLLFGMVTGGESLILIFNLALFIYLIGGLILTSTLFNELHSPATAFQHLTLPTTSLEKLSVAWILGSAGFTLVSILSFGILVLIIFLISILSGQLDTPSIQAAISGYPISGKTISSIGNFFLYQSIFLLGAIYYRKNNFIKTALAIILFFFFLIIFIFFSGITLFLGSGQFNEFMNREVMFFIDAGNIGLVRTLVKTGLMVLFLFLSYLQLKNRQVA